MASSRKGRICIALHRDKPFLSDREDPRNLIRKNLNVKNKGIFLTENCKKGISPFQKRTLKAAKI